MSEIVQGFLACIGAALFFVCVLAAVAPIMSSPRHAGEGGEVSGAPEGDQVHFRAAEDVSQRGASL
ncbi:hypothetical protein G6L46_11885 [Agrobacterium rhizogenes]|uniref:hypothetical protein n=1 Tax=Rhizobium TaxID=379 RepID=UPI00026ED2BF|nr:MULTISPECIES: hypothetical protein [Rhizobium]EJK79460.1 hypothetical protein PMI03_05559 [Rhizobium sp. AP16]NTF87825.1 hypothetical protein [Rhizobium rhizogenes]